MWEATMIPNQRDLFEIPDDVAYLNCSYMSPLLRQARAAGEAAVARKSQPWRISASDFFTGSEETRALFARLVGAGADGVAIIPSVSYGVALAGANLPVAAGQRILTLAEQYPSNLYAWRDLAERSGATIITIPRPTDHDWTAALLAELDERTALVAVPHFHWTDGGRVDLARIGEQARAVGAALVVDGTQSVGASPFDVNVIQPDFLICAAYKWLLGPYSLGFLYAAPHRRAGRPLEWNWITRAGSEDFAGLVNYRDEFQPGARRYDMGERSNFALLPIAQAALEQILEWGVEEIAATLRTMTDEIASRANALGLNTAPPPLRASHLIGLRAKTLPADLPTLLAQSQVYVSVRGDSIRVSPHLYNTPADIERLFATLADALGAGS
jgi:selenocysteine lyase/cysteine desulfurase